jgi:hypothetical protein
MKSAIETNGFEWVLLKYDNKINASIEIERVNLIPILSKTLSNFRGQESLIDEDGILKKLYINILNFTI